MSISQGPAVFVWLLEGDEVACDVRPVLSLVAMSHGSRVVGDERQVAIVVVTDPSTLLDYQLQRRADPGRFILLVHALTHSRTHALTH